MPLHLQGMLMTTQFHTFRPQHQGQTIHRSSSLEMLNNAEFEEKRALIASTLSLNDLLKPGARSTPPPGQAGHFQPGAGGYSGGQGGQSGYQGGYPGGQGPYQGGQVPYQQNGYVVPQSLLKQHNQQQNPHNPNANGYNVNFLNNGVPDKDLGKQVMLCPWRRLCRG